MRVILAGLGNMGVRWVEVLGEHPDVDVVAYVEPDDARRARVASEHGLEPDRLYGSLKDALVQAGAEALIDVTPPPVHATTSGAALRAGLHVLSEKPLADSMKAARELAALSKSRGLVHMVAQNYRFQPVARTLRRLIAEGRVGQVGGVVVRFAVGAHWDPADFRVAMDQPLLLDMSIHHMDLLRACLGHDPRWVRAVTWNPPGSWYRGDAAVSATFGFGDELVVTYHGNWAATGDQTGWSGEWQVEGEAGGLIWERDRLWLAHGQWTEGTREALPIDAQASEGQRAVLDEFLKALREEQAPECSAQDNLASLAMVFGALESARTGQPVEL